MNKQLKVKLVSVELDKDYEVEIGIYSIEELAQFGLVDKEAFGKKEIEDFHNNPTIYVEDLEKGFVWFENLDNVYVSQNTKGNLEFSKGFYENGVIPFEEMGEVIWELVSNETYFKFRLGKEL